MQLHEDLGDKDGEDGEDGEDASDIGVSNDDGNDNVKTLQSRC